MTVARVTQQVQELLVSPSPKARVTQQVQELLVSPIPRARVTQQVLEILVPNDSPPPPITARPIMFIVT